MSLTNEVHRNVMLAVKDGSPEAYGVTIKAFLLARTGKDHSIGTVYAALESLERDGFVASWDGPPEKAREGRGRMYWRVTDRGIHALRKALDGTSPSQGVVDGFGRGLTRGRRLPFAPERRAD